ncbi:MAG: NAD(P)/FAD-dependent oxidoreductase [Clostridia bacterium]|nr:NAD(P)/FAD-dependent oxidoreductase [Clostridia bacterium]
MLKYDVTVIGGGPSGLSAALSADRANAKTLLIEREASLGGILKQCIHDGFGLLRFGEKLSGPEYVYRDIKAVYETDIDVSLLTFVTKTEKTDDGFILHLVNRDGVTSVFTKTIVLCTGCRERTAKQVKIHGTRPAGVFTAGQAQNLVNLHGLMVTKKCVILGSGDIGLIMARRLTLEGAEVMGVYEIKSEPSGLSRNIAQCLNDFDIPLHLSTTVKRVYGHDRLEAVEVAKVDEKMNIIPGTEEIIPCDALILSVGLIPENEIAEDLGVTLDRFTKGPHTDNSFMTDVEGIFAAGNCLHVNDLVDYVSENGALAGKAAAEYVKKERKYAKITIDRTLGYIVPQEIDLTTDLSKVEMYFRSFSTVKNAVLEIKIDGNPFMEKKYMVVRPPEMEKLVLDLSSAGLTENSVISFGIVKKEGDING